MAAVKDLSELPKMRAGRFVLDEDANRMGIWLESLYWDSKNIDELDELVIKFKQLIGKDRDLRYGAPAAPTYQGAFK